MALFAVCSAAWADSNASNLANLNLNNVFKKSTPVAKEKPSAPAASGGSNLLGLLTTQKGVQLSLSYDAFAGYALGWTQKPALSNLGAGFAKSPVFGISSSLSFDARPDPNFRIHGSMSWDFPAYATPYNYTSIPAPSIDEMFADYTVANTFFFRIGKQTINWGAGRFFPIGNLVARVPEKFAPYAPESFDNTAGVGVKVGVPIGPDNVTAIAQIKNGYIASPTSPHLGEVGYGLKNSILLGNTEITVGGYYQMYLAPRALAIVKRTIFGVDTRVEAVLAETPSGVNLSYLANIFWQQSTLHLNIEAEYMYNAGAAQPYINSSEPGFPTGPAAAVLAGFKNIFGSKLDVGVKWEQSFLDDSGIVTPAVIYKPFGHVSITFATPMYYGPTNGAMQVINPDPLGRRLSFGVKVDVSGSD